MKSRWKKFCGAVERIGRGKRILFNLAVTAFFLWSIWMRMGCPLPTMEMELRRYERRNLLTPGEIVFSAGQGEDIQAGEHQASLSPALIVSMGERWAVVGAKRGGEQVYFYQYPLEDGPVADMIYGATGISLRGEGYRLMSKLPILVLGVPEGVAAGEMEMEASDGGLPLTGSGWRIGKGVWLFALYRGGGWSIYSNSPYTLRLYRADGSLLLEKRSALSAYEKSSPQEFAPTGANS